MMSNTNASLPTSRAILTSLFNTLTTTPLPAPPLPPINANQAINPLYPTSAQENSTPTNLLKILPQSHRALLTTLHVLFPPPMLLQALDILDRGLVTRVVQKEEGNQPVNASTAEMEGEQQILPPQANIHLPSSPPLPAAIEPGDQSQGARRHEQRQKKNPMYLVRSSQAPKSRFKDVTAGSGAGGNVYTVHLEAWNCSCAAFAFSAFPGGGSSPNSAPWRLDSGDCEDEIDVDEQEEREWEFGGLSSDGKNDGGNGNVPVCKHLLACLLGERWEGVLGGYVRERKVGKEEMSGLGCGG